MLRSRHFFGRLRKSKVPELRLQPDWVGSRQKKAAPAPCTKIQVYLDHIYLNSLYIALNSCLTREQGFYFMFA